jgi:hypothetical protein
MKDEGDECHGQPLGPVRRWLDSGCHVSGLNDANRTTQRTRIKTSHVTNGEQIKLHPGSGK